MILISIKDGPFVLLKIAIKTLAQILLIIKIANTVSPFILRIKIFIQ